MLSWFESRSRSSSSLPLLRVCDRLYQATKTLNPTKEGEVQFMSYSVYILKCVDHSLYVGCTNALEKRLKQHNNQEIMNSDLTPVPLEAASPRSNRAFKR